MKYGDDNDDDDDDNDDGDDNDGDKRLPVNLKLPKEGEKLISFCCEVTSQFLFVLR